MEAIAILRRLWLRRWIVLGFFVLGVVIAVMSAFHVSTSGIASKQYQVGIGMTRILVDTHSSEVVDVNPYGINDIGGRAQILANLMTGPAVEALIARAAHVPADQLAVTTPPTSGPAVPSQMSQTMAKVSNPAGVYSLTLFTSALPIIQVQSQAPTPAAAASLADAAYVGLHEYLTSVAARDKVPGYRQLVVSTLGSAQSQTVTQGTGLMTGLALGWVAFFVLCVLLLVVEGLIRGWKASGAEPPALGFTPSLAGAQPGRSGASGAINGAWAASDLPDAAAGDRPAPLR